MVGVWSISMQPDVTVYHVVEPATAQLDSSQYHLREGRLFQQTAGFLDRRFFKEREMRPTTFV
jgi:hypothetical protein